MLHALSERAQLSAADMVRQWVAETYAKHFPKKGKKS